MRTFKVTSSPRGPCFPQTEDNIEDYSYKKAMGEKKFNGYYRTFLPKLAQLQCPITINELIFLNNIEIASMVQHNNR